MSTTIIWHIHWTWGKKSMILSTNANRMLIYDEIIITSGSNGPYHSTRS